MDYAIASWVDHLSECVNSTETNDLGSVEKLAGILGNFLRKHHKKGLWSASPPKVILENFHRFQEHDFFNKLVQTIMYARIQLQAPAKQANHKDPLDLLERLADIRSALEKLGSKSTVIQRRKIEEQYGSQLFKCPKVYCKFFYAGFLGLEEREKHLMKHRRAYYCAYLGCHMASLGCVTPVELEKHVLEFHQEIGQVSFPLSSIQDPKSIQILKEVRGRNIGAVQMWIGQFGGEVPREMIFRNDKQSPLSVAILLGDEDLVGIFLRYIPKAVASRREWRWDEVVRVALNEGQEVIVKLLLQHYDGVDDNNWYSLITRALSIDLDKSTLYLLEAGGGFRQRRAHRKSLVLTKAAECGRIFIVRHLISEYNLDPAMADPKQRTALAAASEFGQVGTVKFPLSTGRCSPSSGIKQEETPAFKAASNGHESIIRMLFPPGSDSPEMNAWLTCAQLYNAIRAGDAKLVEQLLREQTIKPDLVDRQGYTPLLHSAELGHDDIVGLLLGHNVNVNQLVQDLEANEKTKKGKTALILATIHEHESTVRRLLSHVNIDTNYNTWFKANRSTPGHYDTALLIAKKVGNVAIATMLNDHLDNGKHISIDVNISNSASTMPPLLSPLPEWWMEKIKIDEEKLRLLESESHATTIATLGARRDRSRQPDTPGVARKLTKSTLANDVTADPRSSTSTEAGKNTDGLNEKLDSNRADRYKLLVKLKYGKRNKKMITRILQIKARPVAEAKVPLVSSQAPAGRESRKRARMGDDTARN
jgi:ankyrin repeat protein